MNKEELNKFINNLPDEEIFYLSPKDGLIMMACFFSFLGIISLCCEFSNKFAWALIPWFIFFKYS